jgi:hypothetical protein
LPKGDLKLTNKIDGIGRRNTGRSRESNECSRRSGEKIIAN